MMNKLFLVVSFLLLNAVAWSQGYLRLQIPVNNGELKILADQGVAVDHGIFKEEKYFISDFSYAEKAIMDQNGIAYEILIADIEQYYEDLLNQPEKPTEAESEKNTSCSNTNSANPWASPATPTHFNLGTMGGYLKYEELLAELDEMAALYPNLITVKAPISNFLTFENRPIYHVKISDNPGQDEAGEPKVLYTAIHHAREPMSLMETVFFMWYLLDNYQVNPEIQYIVNHMQLYFVSCINPDGYVYNQTTNPNGGGIALMTTTRPVFFSVNTETGEAFYNNVFK